MFENCKVIHLIRSMHNWNQYCLWFSVNANIKCQTALNVITLEKKKIRDSLFVKREKGFFWDTNTKEKLMESLKTKLLWEDRIQIWFTISFKLCLVVTRNPLRFQIGMPSFIYFFFYYAFVIFVKKTYSVDYFRS